MNARELPQEVVKAIERADLLSATSSRMRAQQVIDSLGEAGYLVVGTAELADLLKDRHLSPGQATDVTTLTGALNAAIVDLGCMCTDDEACDAHALLEDLIEQQQPRYGLAALSEALPAPDGRNDPSAGTWWRVAPAVVDGEAETWMVQVINGVVRLDGEPIAAREVGVALLAAACEFGPKDPRRPR